MHHKAEHLHIRASDQEKSAIAQAASLKNMSVSQFVLQTTVPLAQEIVRSDVGTVQTVFRLGPEDWEAFNRLLDSPVRELPELKKLLASKAPWEK